MLQPHVEAAARRIADHLQITRPLCILDTETTGVNVEQDRVVELAIVRVASMGVPGCYDVACVRWLVNPGIPIPASATAIHHISDADVMDCASFKSLASVFIEYLAGSDLVGYNARKFDVRILEAEFARAGVPWPCADAKVIDPYVIFVRQEPRDLESAVLFYCDRPVDRDEAHHAMADVGMTIEVLAAQLDRAGYEDVPRDLTGLHAFCENRDPGWLDLTGKILWRDGAAVLGVGKHAGRSLQDLARAERGYLQWMLAKDFPADCKTIIERALRGVFPDVAPEKASV